MVKNELIEKLRIFQAKAGCMHSQNTARRLWHEIRDQIPQNFQSLIETEWNHHAIGEGREGIDYECGRLISFLQGGGKDENRGC